MSEQETGNEPTPVNPMDLIQKPAGLVNESPSDVKPEVRQAAYSELNTASNTPMKEFVPHASMITGDLTEKAREQGYLPIFMGNGRDVQEKANELISKWVRKSAMTSMHKEGDATASMVSAARADWTEYLEKNHPDKTSDEMDDIASNLYRYLTELQDNIRVRSKVMNEEGITNQSKRGSNLVTSDIVGKKPSRAVKGFSVSEIMRRSAIRSENGDFQFDVLLRDSFTQLTFVRTNKLELGNLVNDINRTIKGYVRTIGGNYVSLSYIAATRVVWDFLAKRIVSSSVTGISDFKDLARVVRFSDIDAICMALLRSSHNEGVNLDLTCLSNQCNWSGFKLVDPDKMVKIRKSVETEEDSAVFNNIFNANIKYSVEETLALIDASTFNLPTNRVYNEDESIYLEIGGPSMAEAFETFDFYAAQVNPQLAEIRSKVVDQKEYETQVGLLLTTLGSTEFIHWVKSYVIVAPPNTDGENNILRRSECDPGEFNKGLMDVILDSKVFNRNFSAFILNKTPFMTRTFVGVRNYECPKCQAKTEDAQSADRQLGYTPIDPLAAFFILTQLNQMSHASEAAEATKEAISE